MASWSTQDNLTKLWRLLATQKATALCVDTSILILFSLSAGSKVRADFDFGLDGLNAVTAYMRSCDWHEKAVAFLNRHLKGQHPNVASGQTTDLNNVEAFFLLNFATDKLLELNKQQGVVGRNERTGAIGEPIIRMLLAQVCCPPVDTTVHDCIIYINIIIALSQ